MSQRVVASDGIALAAEFSGRTTAPALLLLNSIGCTRNLWDELAAALADRYRIVRFDMRGHGGSDAPPGDYTIAQLGRDAQAVLDAAGVRRAHVCGLSLGGVVAQWLAIHASACIDRLVLANTASRIGSRDAWEARRQTVLAEGLSAIADLAMARFFSDGFRAGSPQVVARYRADLLGASAQGYAGCCAALRDADFTWDLGRIAAPTLVVGGAHDVSTPADQARALAAAVPGGRLCLLNTAHLSNVEDPVGFAESLAGHLENADGRT